MNDQEYRKEILSDLANSGDDMKEAGSYVLYNARNDREDELRKWLEVLERRYWRLKSHVSSLDSINARIAAASVENTD
jgi:hypothetical protein